jgi:Arabinose-binding domain of AraC transcription regulator, N-term
MRTVETEDQADGGGAGPEPAAEPDSARSTTASFGLWPWVELARRSGMSVEEFCDLADVAPAGLRDAGMRFSQSVANRVAQLAYEQFGVEAAMAAALTVEAGQFSLLELIARTATTVAGGLETGCRFFPLLHSGGKLIHERATDGVHALRWQPPADFEVHPGYVELTFAVALRGIRRETAHEELFPVEVWFTHEAPSRLELHEKVLGAAVRFAMPHDRMVLGAEVAALPLKRENAEIHKAAKKVATTLLDDD